MEERKALKVTRGEILYWMFWGSLLTAKGIGLYDGQKSFKIILIAAVLCLLLKIGIEKYTLKEYLCMGAVTGLTLATYLMSGEKGLLLYGLMMIGLKYVDLKRLFQVGTILWGISFFLITFVSLFRMEGTVYKVHAKLGLGHMFRWSLGYPHPNVLHVSYFVLAVFIIYCLGEKFKIRHAAILLLGNCLVFLYSVSYTGFIVFMVLLSGRVYLLYRKRLCIVEKVLLQLIFPLCVSASLIAPIAVKGKWFILLNELLSTRMELAWRYLKPEYISLFGIRVAEATNERLTMDNAYISAFITYGIIPFAVLCLATMYMIFIYLKRDRYLETLIILSIVAGGMTEPFLYNTSFKNLSFLFMGVLLFDDKYERKAWGILTQKNKQILIETQRFDVLMERIKRAGAFSWKKNIWGLAGAGLLVVLVNCLVAFPEGYIVYRTDCSDLTKEKHYYQEADERYAGYREMEEFKPGEEVEYFTGNIVKIERIRYNIAGIVIGYGLGYAAGAVGIAAAQNRRKS